MPTLEVIAHPLLLPRSAKRAESDLRTGSERRAQQIAATALSIRDWDEDIVAKLQAHGSPRAEGIAEYMRLQYLADSGLGTTALSPGCYEDADAFRLLQFEHLVHATEVGTVRHSDFRDAEYIPYTSDIYNASLHDRWQR